jgi:hypothetical protein
MTNSHGSQGGRQRLTTVQRLVRAAMKRLLYKVGRGTKFIFAVREQN